jgi:hypothetical protein
MTLSNLAYGWALKLFKDLAPALPAPHPSNHEARTKAFADIEKTIILAIEEDRKTRECCKQEREAILYEIKRYKDRAYGERTRQACENIMNILRARSEGEKGE